MNAFHLGRCLGDITTPLFQRYYLRRQLDSLEHSTSIVFDSRPTSQREDDSSSQAAIAHKAGTNCIAIDQTAGRYLISGGADTSIRLWDLEAHPKHSDHENEDSENDPYLPLSTISKATPNSHSHSITSLSIYPFDPTPTTLLTTSYDHSLLLTSITPSTLQPLHKFPLDFTTYTHAISPMPGASPLVAVGTAHPAPRLIDLRTALATHSLPGHTGAIYSLAWHPTKEHILVSSSTDGRILVFDIRRATPAFASFDMDDSIGVVDSLRASMDYTARAHESPITGILFSHDGRKLISASQDQRIRVWDVASGRNDLVHFGPRIRNSREGELKPVLAPTGTNGMKPSQELVFWSNDDGRGEIFMHEMNEGTMLRVLKTKNVVQAAVKTKGKRGKAGVGGNAVSRLTSGGRINSLAFRPVQSEEGLGGAVEMYSAHGDGRICAWAPNVLEGLDVEEGDQAEQTGSGSDDEAPRRKKTKDEVDAEKSRKRKRDLIEGLVEGLTKRPVTFS
ncbi:hypothetical protein PMZ80_004784 [Knufia obscura]|uniref:Uncharacterized protein n=1 Tax=Knufia obscura TaxID=1635080 RepID=A0ABR0RU30_9EURO|nr:hypothetical protein PMZ80_004784 [Knufia obscura]